MFDSDSDPSPSPSCSDSDYDGATEFKADDFGGRLPVTAANGSGGDGRGVRGAAPAVSPRADAASM